MGTVIRKLNLKIILESVLLESNSTDKYYTFGLERILCVGKNYEYGSKWQIKSLMDNMVQNKNCDGLECF